MLHTTYTHDKHNNILNRPSHRSVRQSNPYFPLVVQALELQATYFPLLPIYIEIVK